MAVKRTSLTLCLIHCGQTSWQVDGRVQGAMDLPLCDAGRQALQAECLPLTPGAIATVHHPADEAATETAKLCAARLNAKTKAVKELAEPNLGLLEGLAEQEFAERFPTRYKQWEDDVISLAPPEGEEILHAADRVFHALARILKRTKEPEVAVVLHSMALGLVRCWLADRPLNDMRRMLIDRPRMERYVLPLELIPRLENAAASAHANF